MNSNTRKTLCWIPALWLLLASSGAALLGTWFGERQAHRLVPDEVFTLKGLPEISGLVYLEKKGVLLAVSDAGLAGEISLDGRLLRRRKMEARDLEGVALLPDGKSALVVDEQGQRLLRVGLDQFELQGASPIRTRVPRHSKNRAMEGVALLPGGRGAILLQEEHPCALVWTDLAGKGLGKVVLLNSKSASDLLLHTETSELVVLSRERGLRLLNLQGDPLGPWHPLRVRHAEGLALVPGQGLYVALDKVPGRLALFRQLDSWERLRAFLATH